MSHGRTIRVLSRIIFLLILLHGQVVFARQHLEVSFLNVGEGESIYVKTPEGSVILIDTANPSTAHRVVSFLRSREIGIIDALFITHPHPDHMGGVFQIVSEFSIKNIYDNGQPISEMPQCDIYRWYKETVRNRTNYKKVRSGMVFTYGDVAIEVLWPDKIESSDWNFNSLVLKITYNGRRFLLMGDAGSEVEKILLQKKLDLMADVLKAGHHGSLGTLSEAFLSSVAPSYVVISINKDNIRGYPAEKTLKRLRDRNITTLLTYRDGDIGFIVDEKGGLMIVER